jgi:hypothetical protein
LVSFSLVFLSEIVDICVSVIPDPMKALNPKTRCGLLVVVLAILLQAQAYSQSCPTSNLVSLTTFPNTYYPAGTGSAPSGSTSIPLSAAGYGSHAIVAGDILLIIQMQGADINSSNSNLYGDGTGVARGYLNDANLLAGNMEYVVANSAVPTSGGTLTLKNPTKYSYLNQAYNGTTGQYTYQIVYVPVYYDVALTAQINVPAWNGSSGGVLVLAATDILNFNAQAINGTGSGFRGGASRMLTGGAGSGTDYTTLSTVNTNGGKGEGLAGTPRYINNAGNLLDNTVEGYPNGAEARGAPGNAGGGATDADPSQNDQNSGGGGGSNGGVGGGGGNSWSTNQPVGGVAGAIFAQVSTSRLVMGGGGGGGTTNNGTPGKNGIYSSGVAGGGVVIIYGGTITGNGTINVNGQGSYTNVQNDGSGGGGAGGSVLIYSSSAATNLSRLTVTANGGSGGSNSGNGAMHGPGGGGGGGVIYSNQAIGTTSATGGAAGTTATGSNYGATAGNSGTINQSYTTQTPTFPMSCNLLPVNFLSFAAQPANGNVTLDWVAESQTANDYVVERSFDGTSFDAIGTVPAQTGKNGTASYSYIDNNVTSPTGTLYYRIREEDVTGQDFYSTIVVLKASGAAAAAGVYPNPARESFTLTFTSSAAGAVSLRLFDLGGRLVLNRPVEASTGVNAVTVSGLGTLPEGLYILQWFDGLKPWTSKVMIRH